MTDDHTIHVFDKDLDALSRQVEELASLTEDVLGRAISAGLDGRQDLVDGIISGDERLDELTASIERASIRILALRQPRADDLRRPVAAMKIALNLERCGDLAKNIAKRGRQLARLDLSGLDLGPVRRMGEKVQGSLKRLHAAYAARDLQGVLGVWHGDAEIDEIYDKVSESVLSTMTATPDAVEAGMHLLFITKNLERIGDHATNIAELIHYEFVGTGPVGNRPKLDPLDMRLEARPASPS